MSQLLRSISVILCAAVFFVETATAIYRTGVVAFSCGPTILDQATGRGQVIADVLDDLKTNTARNNGNYWARKPYHGPDGLETCFGHSTCEHGISAEECIECLRAAKVKIFLLCGFKTSAMMRLQDCYMRYGFEEFDD